MQEALRIVVIISDPALVAEGDEQAQAIEERSRLLRIGLLEAGYNLVATLPADVFLTERLAQLQTQLRRLRVDPEGSNVVMQGDVTRIVSMSARERRGIIDELAGVALFDSRIEQTRGKLDEVQERVERCRIVEQELLANRVFLYKLALISLAALNAALFHIETDDEIVVAGASGGRTSYQNAGRTLRQGLELAAESEFARNLTGRAALTWMKAEYDEAFISRNTTIPSGNRIPGVPQFAAYAELAWKPIADVTLAGEAVYRGKVHVSDTNTEPPAPAYTLFNLRLAAEQRQGPWTFGQLLRVVQGVVQAAALVALHG